jgi:hypothetical protein
MKIRTKIVVFLAISFTAINCKNKPITQSLKFQNSIPFEITQANNIAVKSIINNSDTVDLMFHTAVNSISIIEASIDKIPSVNFGDTIDVKSWGGASTSLMSKRNKIKFGNIQFDNESISICKHSGHFTDGKFGYNYFEHKILNIDFDNNLIILHDNFPSIDTSYRKSKLKIENGNMFIKAQATIDNKVYDKWFLIHSGYSKTFLFDDRFVTEQNLNIKLKTLDESELKDSYGNILKTKNVEIPKITINNFEFKNQSVGIFEGKISNQTMSVMGCEILKKFNIIIDYQNQDIYLKRSKYFPT